MLDPTPSDSAGTLPVQKRGPYWVGTRHVFPPAHLAGEHGLVAIGGDLEPGRILAAYRSGIFPWPLAGEGLPMMWWSPDPRCVLELSSFHMPRSVRRAIRRGRFRVTFDGAFVDVIANCAGVPRPKQQGTWITPAMATAYRRLHRLGFAHSVESWEGERLVGGLYGIALGGVFFGESMFARESEASKVALAVLVDRLRRWSYDLIDCQQETDHMLRLGARAIPVESFLMRLRRSSIKPDRAGSWAEQS